MIAALDKTRARLLRLSFRVGWLERVYRSRALRLSFLFAISLAIALPCAVLLPVLPLLIGPLIAGPLHVLVSGSTIASRLRARVPWSRLTFTALLGAATVGFTAATLGGRNPLALAGVAGAVFALAHNFIAFAYWWRATKTGDERRAVAIAAALLACVTFGLLWGAFDPLLFLSPLNEHLPMLFYDLFSSLADAMSTEWTTMTLRLLAAFALTQSMHYFIWLKAIPDQRAAREIPPSFSARWSALVRRLGAGGAFAVVLLCFSFVAIACVSLESATIAYFAFSGLHGWLEIAALGVP